MAWSFNKKDEIFSLQIGKNWQLQWCCHDHGMIWMINNSKVFRPSFWERWQIHWHRHCYVVAYKNHLYELARWGSSAQDELYLAFKFNDPTGMGIVDSIEDYCRLIGMHFKS